MDWSHGKVIISSFQSLLYNSLSQLLNLKVSDILTTNGSGRAESQNMACQEIVKTLIKMISNLKGSAATGEYCRDQSEGLTRDIALQIFDSTQRVALSTLEGDLFIPENRFMSCLLLSWILELFGNPLMWIPRFFGSEAPRQFLDSNVHKDFFISDIYRFDLTSSDPNRDYNICAFARSLCTTSQSHSSSSLLTCVDAGGALLIEVLYDHIVHVIRRTRVVSFQALAAWLEAVKQLIESKRNTHHDIRTKRSLISRNLLEECFEYVFVFWDDPIDSVQHKLRDIILCILDILKLDKELVLDIDRDNSFLDKMLDTLLNADWYKKVKYVS